MIGIPQGLSRLELLLEIDLKRECLLLLKSKILMDNRPSS